MPPTRAASVSQTACLPDLTCPRISSQGHCPGCSCEQIQMSRPLRSTPITGASPLLRAGPPAGAATVLSASSFSCPARSLSHPANRQAQYQHPPSRVPCVRRRPGSRRLHSGPRLASKRVSARLLPGLLGCPGSDATYLVSTLHQRFAHARLPDPRLTRNPGLFLIAHHDGLQPTQHEAALRLPPQGDAREPAIPHLPHSTAIRSPYYPRQPPRVRGTPQLPSVPSLIPSSFATRAIGRDVSITIFTASSLNSGEKLFFGRGNYFTFPDGPSYWMDCPEGSGHLTGRKLRCSIR